MSDLLTLTIRCAQKLIPTLTDDLAAQLEDELRRELAGDRASIRGIISKTAEEERAWLKDEVKRRFNGRNASEVARELKIGRATVYRILKTPGR